MIDTPAQLRKDLDQESIEELAKDIQARGLLQPILLNPINDRYWEIFHPRRKEKKPEQLSLNFIGWIFAPKLKTA